MTSMNCAEQVVGVVRPGEASGWYCTQNTGLRGVLQTLDRAVVQVEVRHFDVVRHRCRIDGKPVILRRDLDLAGSQLLDGMVRAAVPELQLEGLRAHRQAEDLVAEADAERRHVALR